MHAFADDLQIYGSTAQNGAADLMARMSICIECVASWMSSIRLWLNPSKTELIWLGTSRRLQHCDRFNMTVCGADVRPVDCVRDLGVLIDINMTLSNHVNNVAGICFHQLRQLRIIRRYQTTDLFYFLIFFDTIFVSSHMYPVNPEGTQVIVGSMNMGYISDTVRNRTHNLFRLKRELIPLGHSDGQMLHTRWFGL